MEDLHIGGVYKIIDEDYAHQHSMGSGFDLGLQWRNLWKRVDLGATVDNFGTPIALGGNFALLPLQIKLGTALHLTDDWLLAADYEYQPFDYFVSWHFGTEYGYKIGPLQTYARVGYTLGPVQDQGANAGFSAGLGRGPGLLADRLRLHPPGRSGHHPAPVRDLELLAVLGARERLTRPRRPHRGRLFCGPGGMEGRLQGC